MPCIFVFSIQASAQGQNNASSMEQLLTAQEQNEYRERLGNASDDQQRQEIQNQYEKKVQDRALSGSQRGEGVGQGKGGAHSQQGGGAAISGGYGGPAGSKSKPQKSGK
ncbi:MAG: hypothetical protein R3E64_17915 [Halioglobus sp.]